MFLSNFYFCFHGESDIACAGLPTPREDHALTMSKFARSCLVAFESVTKQLERSMGPDTGELMMRFGLHSGPCTAGVLRGERVSRVNLGCFPKHECCLVETHLLVPFVLCRLDIKCLVIL